MTNFLTVKDAAKVAGKSASSIRRIIYPILENDSHPDRHHIEPSVDAARELRLKGENFPWKISEELLQRFISSDATKPKQEPKTATANDSQSAIIEMLRDELKIKNRQIETQNDLLKGLSERLREGNILIGSLQQQMALLETSRTQPNIVDAKEPTPQDSQPVEQGSGDPGKKTRKHSWLFTKIF